MDEVPDEPELAIEPSDEEPEEPEALAYEGIGSGETGVALPCGVRRKGASLSAGRAKHLNFFR